MQNTFRLFVVLTVAASLFLPLITNAYAAEEVPTFTAKVGELKKITFKLKNYAGKEQPFVHFIQVKNPSGVTEQLSWVGGVLQVDQEIRPQQSWIPENVGEYTVEIFIWGCYEQCSPLSPVLTMKVIVEE
jgi:hypothetical protein